MAGEKLGTYRLETLLGRGGMGKVYLADDTVRQRAVALKLLPEQLTADPEFVVRFRRESRIAAQLRDPHVVPIHDFGEIDGQLFIDMRLVEDVDLGALLATDCGPVSGGDNERGELPTHHPLQVDRQPVLHHRASRQVSWPHLSSRIWLQQEVGSTVPA